MTGSYQVRPERGGSEAGDRSDKGHRRQGIVESARSVAPMLSLNTEGIVPGRPAGGSDLNQVAQKLLHDVARLALPEPWLHSLVSEIRDQPPNCDGVDPLRKSRDPHD